MRSLRALLVAALVLVLGGCFRSEERLAVRADGGGTYAARIEVDLQALRDLERSFPGGGGPGLSVDDLPIGRVERNGAFREVTRTEERLVIRAGFGFTDQVDFARGQEELSSLLADGAAAGPEAPGTGQLTVVRAGDDVRITYRSDRLAGLDLGGGDTAGLGAIGDLLSARLKPEATVSITGPGRVRSSNADQVQGATATWDLLRPGAPAVLTVTTAAAASVAWPSVLAGASIILVLVAVGVLLVRRAPRPVPWPEEPSPPAPPTDPEPSAPLPDWPAR